MSRGGPTHSEPAPGGRDPVTGPSEPSPLAARAASSLRLVELAVLGLFFLSGASALIYEVVWTRGLTNVFGGSAFAIATVLAAYMAGLALGSTTFGRAIDRKGHPLVVYGVLEAGIALWALLLPFLLTGLNGFYARIYQSLNPGFYTLSLLRFVLCFLVLLVPTTLMGGTLPVLGKLLLRNWGGLGARAGLLYGVNTLGAVAGVAGGGFLLLPWIGLTGSTHVAVVFNFLVAALALLLALRLPYSAEEPKLQEAETSTVRDEASPALRRAVLLVYGASGFAALAYEVAWTKTLSMILGTTTYAFSSMLTIFLLGLSLGSLVAGRIVDRYRRPAVLLVVVQTAIPLAAVLSIPLLQMLPQLFVDGFPHVRASWAKIEMFQLLLAGLVMIVPTFFMGAMFPLVTRTYVARGRTATSLGLLYASNTVGAILGSFITGFVLIPGLGRQDSILAATVVNLLAAGFLLWTLGWRALPSSIRVTLAVLLVLLVPAGHFGLTRWDPYIMASGVYAYAPEMKNVKKDMMEHELLYYHEETEAIVSVWNSAGGRTLRINGKVDASSHGDMLTQKLCGHLPGLYRAGQPGGDVLLIGLASGASAGAILVHPFARLETCELLKGVPPATRYFNEYNRNCLEDPRHHLIINDGRNHLLLTDRTYDVIVSEPTNPEIAGVGSLFTREFFELTRKRLKPGGLLCQWTQLYHLRPGDVRALLGTIREVYPHVHLWEGTTNDLLMIASMEPLRIDLPVVQAELRGAMKPEMDLLEIASPAQLLSYFVTDESGIDAFVGGTRKRITDANLLLEYAAPRNAYTPTWANVLDLVPHERPLLPYLAGAEPGLAPEIARYRRAHLLAVKGTLRGPGVAWAGSTRDDLELALEIAPTDILARTQIAEVLVKDGLDSLKAGNSEAAVARLARAAVVGDRLSRGVALHNLGSIAYQAGQVDSAETFWLQAAREGNHEVSYNLALVDAYRGDYAAAIKNLEAALRWYPDNAFALNNTAYFLALTGQELPRALSCARRAVRLNADPEHKDTLGFVLMKSGQYAEAEAILADLVKKHPEKMDGLLHLGMARAGRGNREGARAAFNTVVQTSTDPDLVRQAQDALGKL